MQFFAAWIGLVFIVSEPSGLLFDATARAARQVFEVFHPVQALTGPDMIMWRHLFRVIHAGDRHIDPAVLALVPVGELCSADRTMRSVDIIR